MGTVQVPRVAFEDREMALWMEKVSANTDSDITTTDLMALLFMMPQYYGQISSMNRRIDELEARIALMG